VVTKLLQRSNIGTATERLQNSVTKKTSSMERYLKFKEISICSLFFFLTQSIKINDNFINIHNLVVTHSTLYSFSDVSSKTKQYK
jgi:hypothetical protein